MTGLQGWHPAARQPVLADYCSDLLTGFYLNSTAGRAWCPIHSFLMLTTLNLLHLIHETEPDGLVLRRHHVWDQA